MYELKLANIWLQSFYCKVEVCQNYWTFPQNKSTQISVPKASVVAVRRINQDSTEDVDKGEEEVRKGDFDSFLVWP